MAVDIYSSETPPETAPARCPINHEIFARRKTVRAAEGPGPAVERDASGTWHVRDYALARAILRGDSTRQAGFKAELLAQVSTIRNQPVLFLEGQPHHQQRRQTARFFTPRAVGSNYRALMEHLSDELIGKLHQHGRADLSDLSMTLAVRVAAEVVGLTNSRLPGMDRRLDAFFASAPGETSRLRMILDTVRNQAGMFAFFMLDVKPAIQARRAAPREDVISHLIGQGYSEPEILTECVTYGAAGMATTREFICAAAWHMLEQPALRQRYLAAGEDERYAILHEILRAEPVVGNLKRRATADIPLEQAGVTIPQGALINLHIAAINADEALVGEHAEHVCPGRALAADNASSAVMSFGDGAHRCPGAYVAIQESDIFLQRLLAIDTLRIERGPTLTWNELVTGYELRDFIVVA